MSNIFSFMASPHSSKEFYAKRYLYKTFLNHHTTKKIHNFSCTCGKFPFPT